MTSGCDVGENAIEGLVVDGADEGLGCAVGGDDHECRLRRDIEVRKDVPRIVTELRERQAVLVDEALKALIGSDPGNADERDLVTPALVCRLDRGGFCVATASSGRPEPERRWFPSHRRTLEVAAADEWAGELQHCWHHGDGVRHRIGACRIGARRPGAR